MSHPSSPTTFPSTPPRLSCCQRHLVFLVSLHCRPPPGKLLRLLCSVHARCYLNASEFLPGVNTLSQSSHPSAPLQNSNTCPNLSQGFYPDVGSGRRPQTEAIETTAASALPGHSTDPLVPLGPAAEVCWPATADASGVASGSSIGTSPASGHTSPTQGSASLGTNDAAAAAVATKAMLRGQSLRRRLTAPMPPRNDVLF